MKLSISYSTGYPRLSIDGQGDTLIVNQSLDLQALQNIEVKNLIIQFKEKEPVSGTGYTLPNSSGTATVTLGEAYTGNYLK